MNTPQLVQLVQLGSKGLLLIIGGAVSLIFGALVVCVWIIAAPIAFLLILYRRVRMYLMLRHLRHLLHAEKSK